MNIDIEKNKQEIITLLKPLQREGISKLIDWLEYHSDFFTAPASSKFHLACKGGLAQHSLSVYRTLDHLCVAFWKGMKIPIEARIIVGLLHDLCKVGIYHWGKKKGSTDWGYFRDDSEPFGHGDKSVIILQKFIKLTDQEIAMIRWHMGPYDPEYNRSEKDITIYYPECKLVYFADDISTQYLEK